MEDDLAKRSLAFLGAIWYRLAANIQDNNLTLNCVAMHNNAKNEGYRKYGQFSKAYIGRLGKAGGKRIA
jgi:hypothetical protein